MASSSRFRLGRGLDSLISNGAPPPPPPKAEKKKDRKAETPEAPETPPPAAPAPAPAQPPALAGYREIPLGEIDPNPRQPRREFAPEAIAELAQSIAAEGLLQPVVVRPVGGRFQLIAGERRWRACQSLGHQTIAARILEVSDASSAILSLIENLQRADLNPIEEALGYGSLMKDFGLTQEAVADRVGKGRATIANALRLLSLPRDLQGMLARGQLSTGHAKVLLSLEDDAQRLLLARRIIEEGRSVRETENLVKALKTKQNGVTTPPPREVAVGAGLKDIERRLATHLSTRVLLKQKANNRGQLVIEYYGDDDLQRLLGKLHLG